MSCHSHPLPLSGALADPPCFEAVDDAPGHLFNLEQPLGPNDPQPSRQKSQFEGAVPVEGAVIGMHGLHPLSSLW